MLFQFFTALHILLEVTAAIGESSFPYVENQAPSTTNFLYMSSEPSAVYSGYSYTTQNFNGAGSNVVFTTGPRSLKNFKIGRNILRQSMTTVPEENLNMDVQYQSERDLVSPMMDSVSQDMEMSSIDSNVQSFYQQTNEVNENQEQLKSVKEDTAMPQSSPLLQNSNLKKNSLYLRFQPVITKIYVLENVNDPRYIDNSYGLRENPMYTFNNPIVRLLYQTSFLSNANDIESTIVNDKNSHISYHTMNNQNQHFNCSTSNSMSTVSKMSKTIPASEYLTNPIKNKSLNIPSIDMTDNSKSKNEQSQLDKLNTTEMPDKHVILSENTTETITTEMSKM